MSLHLNPLHERVIAEARSWIGTPWQHNARVKGAGVDCAQFLIAVYSEVGLIEAFQPEHYAQDWNLHRDEEKFINNLLCYTEKVNEPRACDIAMFRYGRHAAHGAIVLDDKGPVIIHAWRDERMVTISDLATNPIRERLTGYYRLKGDT